MDPTTELLVDRLVFERDVWLLDGTPVVLAAAEAFRVECTWFAHAEGTRFWNAPRPLPTPECGYVDWTGPWRHGMWYAANLGPHSDPDVQARYESQLALCDVLGAREVLSLDVDARARLARRIVPDDPHGAAVALHELCNEAARVVAR